MYADLKPSKIKKIAGETVIVWVFDGPYPQGKWLSCEYAGGIASLSRRIADTTSECTVKYGSLKQGAQVVREITCR